MISRVALVVGCSLVLAHGCASSAGADKDGKGSASKAKPGKKPGKKSGASKGWTQRGKAAWYGGKWHGRPTANGERFNQNAMTAAHRTLPFGTIVRVTNLLNKKSVKVRINDRGPWGKKERIIDVSRAAAAKLGMLKRGVVPVKLEVVRRPKRFRQM